MRPITRVYFDTNIFIYAFEETGTRSDLLSRIFLNAIEPHPHFVTSELTLSELLVKPHRDQRRPLIKQYEGFIQTTGWLLVPPVSRSVLLYAAALRAAQKGLKLPDAIHLAAAFASGCSHFLTGDNGISGPYDLFPLKDNSTAVIPSLEIIRPDEATLTALLEGLTP